MKKTVLIVGGILFAAGMLGFILSGAFSDTGQTLLQRVLFLSSIGAVSLALVGVLVAFLLKQRKAVVIPATIILALGFAAMLVLIFLVQREAALDMEGELPGAGSALESFYED